jgi:hypothetical protein
MSWAAWAHTPKRNASRWCLRNWFLPGMEFKKGTKKPPGFPDGCGL